MALRHTFEQLVRRAKARLRAEPAARRPPDPRAAFILVLCIASGIPLAAGAVRPYSMEALLPRWAVMVWGALLVIGAVLALVGMPRQTPGGIITEQIGMATVGVATIYYAITIIVAAGTDGLLSAAITAGWGVSCFWRWLQLRALIASAVQKVKQRHER